MFDVELAFGPIKAKYSGAANQSVQVWPIQRVIDAKGLVAHLFSFRSLSAVWGRMPVVQERSETWAERIGFTGASTLIAWPGQRGATKAKQARGCPAAKNGTANDNAG